MNTESAELFLRCHRPGVRGTDPRIQRAVKIAQRDEQLKTQLDAQLAFDDQVAASIAALEVPDGLDARLDKCVPEDERPRLNFKTLVKQPPFLAVVFGLLVLASWGGFYALSRMQGFPGKEKAAALVEINDDMTGMELEPKSAEIGNLEDWFFSKYGFEDFYVPPALASYKTVGARVFKQDGVPVAQLAVEKNHMICYMFRAEDLGVKIAPDDKWRVFVDDEWVAAVQQHEEACFMIAFRGKRSEMNAFLATLK